MGFLLRRTPNYSEPDSRLDTLLFGSTSKLIGKIYGILQSACDDGKLLGKIRDKWQIDLKRPIRIGKWQQCSTKGIKKHENL